MTESKQKLIKLLEATLIKIEGLPEQIEQEDILQPDGIHVDTEFMMAILHYIESATGAGARIMKALQKLLGIEEVVEDNKKSPKKGVKWNAAEILRHCTFKENTLYLPDVQFTPKAYADVKTWILEAGGKWTGGKVQGFTFDFDASRVAAILMSGKRCNLKKEFQFFSTPAPLADWLVSLSDVTKEHAVLEPSAGTGAIIDAIHRVCPDVEVDAFELMPENLEILRKKCRVNIVGDDFSKGVPRLYDRIFANPPFSKNQDIRHVRMMYDALDPDSGQMCVITSQHWMTGPEKECELFRSWLQEVNAELHKIPRGVFEESGTNVATCALVIKNPNYYKIKSIEQ